MGSMLDPERSIITAKDFAGDGNTFKATDYLMADPMNHDQIWHKGMVYIQWETPYILNILMLQNRQHFQLFQHQNHKKLPKLRFS